jgi:prepilin-type N-terminal cleavage/methylation domain-containing protein
LAIAKSLEDVAMRKGFSLVELLVVIAIIAILIGLIIPAVSEIRHAAALLESQNNLRQMGIGFHNLAQTHQGRLPSLDEPEQSRFKMAPFVELLPYVEQTPAYQVFVRDQETLELSGIHSPTIISIYQNPLDRSFSLWPKNDAITSYALNAVLFKHPFKMEHIKDGLSQTIMISEHYAVCDKTAFYFRRSCLSGHRAATFAHQSPLNTDSSDYIPLTSGWPPVSVARDNVTFQSTPSLEACDRRLPNATSYRGLQAVLADGSVRVITKGVSASTFWGAVTPNGGEVLGDW